MDPLIGAALVGGLGGSFLSGLFGAGASSEANEANLQAVRETNAQNYKIFQEQLGFNERMWNQTNEYNSPKNQRKLYEQAGINPYLALTNMASGEAGMQTAPTAPQMQAPHVEPVNYMQGLGDAVGSASDFYLKSQQAENVGLQNREKLIDLKFRAQEKYFDLLNKRQDLLSKQVKTEFDKKQIDSLDQMISKQKTELKYYDDMLSSKSEQERELARKNKYEADEADYKAGYQKLLNEAFPGLNKAQLAVYASQAASNYASAEASRESAKTSKKLGEKYGAETETENQMRPLRTAAQDLANKLANKQITLADLGINKATYDSERYGKLLDHIQNSRVKAIYDELTWYLGQSIGRLSPLGSFLK